MSMLHQTTKFEFNARIGKMVPVRKTVRWRDNSHQVKIPSSFPRKG